MLDVKEAAVVEARDPRVARGGSMMENMVVHSELRSERERSQRPGDEKGLRQCMKTEHYRLHCVEIWPDSPYKEAVLAAARSVLERLEAASIEPFESPICMVCATRRNQTRKVLMFRSRPKASPVVMKPAA